MTDPRSVDAAGRLTIVFLIAVFVALVFHQAIRPLLAARRDMNAFREAVQILTNAEGSVDRLDEEIQTVAEEIAASKALLPRSVNLDGFLEYLGDVAATTETHIEKLRPREVEDHRLYRELPLDVDVSGAFLKIYAFLEEIEEGDRLSRVERLKLTRNKTGRECKAEMRLALFFAKEDGG